ncbi:hypothetical protein I4F81_002711 [Pyropia yezoensis]|uniref:Uncharacterized protein n=1 Tax=Pyropia yezoensis TaxID=2788 RepID=A0ACC3BQI1_PYRYE|nr:hypothetical protein I4F81_002711 [Neopyropia yezoensis]
MPTPVRQKTGEARDAQLVVGAAVHSDAINLSNFAKCSRFLGAAAKTTMVSGVVIEVVRGKTKAGRGKTDLRVTWQWLGREMDKVLALRSVRAGAPPGTTSPV